MLGNYKLEQNAGGLFGGIFSDLPESLSARSEAWACVHDRLEELKRYAAEDGDCPPLTASKDILLSFLSLFNLRQLPEITLTDDGCYYLRVLNGQNKLVARFLADGMIHYLIEKGADYTEEINSLTFFKNTYYDMVRELIFDD